MGLDMADRLTPPVNLAAVPMSIIAVLLFFLTTAILQIILWWMFNSALEQWPNFAQALMDGKMKLPLQQHITQTLSYFREGNNQPF